MSSFAKLSVLGRLVNDPDLRYTASGTSVCRFTVAINERYRNSSGNVQEHATFLDVDSFGRAAEMISKYFVKGSRILLDGRLRQEDWIAKDGTSRRKLKCVLDAFYFVDGSNSDRSRERGDSKQEDRGGSPRGGGGALADASLDDDDSDDVPF